MQQRLVLAVLLGLRDQAPKNRPVSEAPSTFHCRTKKGTCCALFLFCSTEPKGGRRREMGLVVFLSLSIYVIALEWVCGVVGC